MTVEDKSPEPYSVRDQFHRLRNDCADTPRLIRRPPFEFDGYE